MVSEKWDPGTEDWSTCRLKLRHGLVFAPLQCGGKIFYHIEVTSQGKFFRIGVPEYTFVSLLDGSTSVAEALTITAQRLGSDALSEQQAAEVVRWLMENRLVEGEGSGARVASDSAEANHSPLREFGALSFKLRLGNPDKLLGYTLPYVRWLCGAWGFAIAGSLALWGLVTVLGNNERFLNASQQIFAPGNWLWMLAFWFGLKVVHEFAHGLVCKHYGGEVREMGLLFVLFAPLAYVDVTSSWRLESKWQRIHIAVAGILFELSVAALAIIGWGQVQTGVAAYLLYNLFFTASVSTIAFNINPLMKFDGYYVLSDLVGRPNLYREATELVHAQVRRVLWGVRAGGPALRGVTRWLMLTYGWGAMVWRTVIFASLLIVAASLAEGAGMILALGAMFGWFRGPLLRFVAQARIAYQEEPLRFARAMMVLSSVGGLTYAVWNYAPNPLVVSVPGVVEYRGLAVVRSEADGFIEKVLVEDGEWVKEGQLLMELRNAEIVGQYRETECELAQCRARQAIAREDKAIADLQVEQAKEESLLKQFAERKREFEGLQVRAPKAGRLIAGRLRARLGAFVHRGDEILAVGDEGAKELRLLVGHEAVNEAIAVLGEDVGVRVGARRRERGRLATIDPRAARELEYPALAATAGGTLPVREVVKGEVAGKNEERREELLEPRFRATVTLSEDVSKRMAAGERGYAVLGRSSQTLGTDLVQGCRAWLKRQWQMANEAT
jgi:putative peptide zinc metalloprotease protein